MIQVFNFGTSEQFPPTILLFKLALYSLRYSLGRVLKQETLQHTNLRNDAVTGCPFSELDVVQEIYGMLDHFEWQFTAKLNVDANYMSFLTGNDWGAPLCTQRCAANYQQPYLPSVRECRD